MIRKPYIFVGFLVNSEVARFSERLVADITDVRSLIGMLSKMHFQNALSSERVAASFKLAFETSFLQMSTFHMIFEVSFCRVLFVAMLTFIVFKALMGVLMVSEGGFVIISFCTSLFFTFEWRINFLLL